MNPREFYVGYLEKAPRGVADFTRIFVLIVALLATVAASLWSLSQARFDPGIFEFGNVAQHEGVLIEKPHPLLLTAEGPRLLVALGKNGAAPAVVGLDGQRVRLNGTKIERKGWTMLELDGSAIESIGEDSTGDGGSQSLGPIDIVGEVVDSKCFLGVMKPGRGKPHRACASLCLEGGIPPALHVRDPEGAEINFLLLDENGAALPKGRFMPFVAEAVRVEGDVHRRSGLLEIRVSELVPR